MTPDRRLDQLEPLMADVLQKVDQLIKMQGQILDLAARGDQKADITAKGVAELTLLTNKQFDQMETNFKELKAGQQAILQFLREKLP